MRFAPGTTSSLTLLAFAEVEDLAGDLAAAAAFRARANTVDAALP